MDGVKTVGEDNVLKVKVGRRVAGALPRRHHLRAAPHTVEAALRVHLVPISPVIERGEPC